MEKIKIGAVIQMVKTGKRYIVEEVKPSAAWPCDWVAGIVNFSRSALKQRIAVGSAIVVEH